MSRNVLIGLILGHLGLGVLTAFFAVHDPVASTAIFFAVVFCQTSLLGIWVGFGHAPVVVRVLVAATASVYLSVLLAAGIDEFDTQVYWLVTVATGGVALSTWIYRIVRTRVGRLTKPGEPAADVLQFSIRHLMYLTVAVACLISLGKLLAPVLPQVNEMTSVSILGLCYVVVAFVTSWSMLGLGKPIYRVPFVFMIAVPSGLLSGYTLGGIFYAFWTSTTVLQAVLLIVSLLVVRMGGFRLVSKREQR